MGSRSKATPYWFAGVLCERTKQRGPRKFPTPPRSLVVLHSRRGMCRRRKVGRQDACYPEER